MSVKTSIPKVFQDWKILENQYGTNPVPTKALERFLQENFDKVDGDSQLEKWVPAGWQPHPKIIDRIRAPEYKYFAKELNHLWLKLGRKMSKNVMAESGGQTSLIYVPHGFIVPGGRFRELYYWDTYFILLGLLVCDMHETAKGLVENLLHLVKNYGHIYNGSRIYYQYRSQPPFLLQMVKRYVECTGDFSIVRDNFEILEKEIQYWNDSRRLEVTVDGRKYEMFRYFCSMPGPRPESYREDVAIASFDDTDEGKLYRYQAIGAACESGWDFSSRWFKCKRGNALVDLHTQEIVPVDLNSFMHMNYELLREWAVELGMEHEAEKYAVLSTELKTAIEDLLWDEEDGIWYDLDLRDGSKNRQYASSNFTPLWTKSFDESRKAEIAGKILAYYNKYNLWKLKGGMPSTLCFSGEQWDWPNAWAPLQLIASEGFRNVGLTELAFDVANNWTNNNFSGYLKHNLIFEKYDCRRPGMTGFGGEYEEQVGFGWSNGVLFAFMNDYADRLEPFSPDKIRTPPIQDHNNDALST
ncbi:unnamed protein product [Nesidiocoris tenuis]|uniref:Trehalase n=1 Tax=Nesidiocoris tenuis TaxID=355587 RepID=A0A6H5HRK4_9HEMI|nr:unnamed protein product [Nesidiocoris tenuis]